MQNAWIQIFFSKKLIDPSLKYRFEKKVLNTDDEVVMKVWRLQWDLSVTMRFFFWDDYWLLSNLYS